MTGRERMIRAMKRQPVEGHAPHFELVFFLTMEKFGMVHPSHRTFGQWKQMSAAERQLHVNDIADCLIRTAQTYHHDAINIQQAQQVDMALPLMEAIREKTGGEYFLIWQRDPTFSIPDGEGMMDFSIKMYDEPEKLHGQAKRELDACIQRVRYLARSGLMDGVAMCSDYAFNVNPFFTPDQFEEFVFPYLKAWIDECRSLGLYSIKHTDGNIAPILDQIVAAGPDALHSIDPQGGMSLREVRAKYGDRICTIGNVNCGLLQTGTQEEADADVRRCLHEGMDDGQYGFVFATSNCVYTGLDLARYERMVDIWQREGVYGQR